MHFRSAFAALALLLAMVAIPVSMAAAPAAAARSQPATTDDGRDNPVVADVAGTDNTSSSNANYVALSLVAVCLIVAGILLVKVERWEARRIPHADATSG